MIDIKAATAQWITLLLLSAMTFTLAETGYSGDKVILPVLLATFIKGSLVIDRFMALRYVAGPWRMIVLAWLLVVLVVVWLSFTRI